MLVTLPPAFLHSWARAASSTTDSSRAVSSRPAGPLWEASEGVFSRSLDFVICGDCLQAAAGSQEEGKAEGSWHSISRKLGLSSSGSGN